MDFGGPPAALSLWHYAFTGDFDKLSSLISHSATAIDILDDENRTPLHLAAAGGSTSCITYLLEKGANSNAKDCTGKSPLQNASFRGFVDCMKILIEKGGAEVNTKDNEESTPLHKTSLLQSSDPLEYLISKGGDIFARTIYHDTPLHYAAAGGSVSCMELLIKHGADVNAIDEEDVTPLHQAAFSGHGDAVTLLLRKGARVDAKDQIGTSPLHSAASAGHIECIDLLVNNGEFVNVVDTSGISPLHQAAFHGFVHCVKRLVQLGAKVEMRDETGETALHKAAFNGHVECCVACIDHGVDVNAKDTRSETPLHLACFNGFADCVEFLLKSKALLDARDSDGETPMHYAALNGHLDCVRHLVKYGADINLSDEEGSTSLHKAAFNGHLKVVKLLLKYSARVGAKDSQGGTPLHNASYNGHYETIFVLLKNSASVDEPDNRGCTPMHLAASVGSKQCVEVLLANGAAVDTKTDAGKTPLLYALKKQHAELARYLIKNGADLFGLTNNKETNSGSAKERKDNRCSFEMYHIFGTTDPSEVLHIVMSRDEDSEARQADLDAKLDAERKAEQAKESQKKSTLKEAVVLFNQKPEKALDFLVENGIIQKNPKEIAKWLTTTDDLSKQKIGEYLGEGTETNIAVLKSYAELFDFAGNEFDQALRGYLKTFRLPGEAQKIDRMMEAFAQRFYSQNTESVFASSDAAYILAFAVIMLHTDAHSLNVKKKMTKQQFVGNNRGINAGGDFPVSFMEKLYDNITNNEFQMHHVEQPGASSGGVPFTNASKKGWLTKQGGRIKTWKRRWFILSDNCLFYFKSPGDAEPCGIIPLENVTVSLAPVSVNKRAHCFMLQNHTQELMKACKVGSDGTLVKANHLVYFISASGTAEMDAWIAAINSNIHKNPFWELISKKEAQLNKTKATIDGKNSLKRNKNYGLASPPATPDS